MTNSSGASSLERFDLAGDVLVCDKHGIAQTSTKAIVNKFLFANPSGIIVFITIPEFK